MAYGLTQSIDFEASSSQYASILDASQTGLDLTTDFTLEGWIKLESMPGSFDYAMISKFLNTGNQRSYAFEVFDDAGTTRFQGYVSADGTTGNSHRVAVTMSTATWYHVAFTYDVSAGTSEFFQDGTSLGTVGSGVTSIFNSTARVQISGLNGPAALYMDGKQSLWRVWSTIRTQAQISANMCSVLGATTDLQAEWTFDNVYTDNSGNSNTLTATGSPVFSADVPSTCSVSTTVKTYNGATTATVKTVLNGTVIASRKTWNGIT